MAVRFDEKKNLFTLQTLDSTYQMKVDDHGVLLHTYYGAPADETDFSYLIGPEDRGFSGQPGDEKKDRTYSMDYYPLEYPVQGNGDFRVKALKAGFEGEVLALDLRFVSYELEKGKYSLPGLPALFEAEAGEVETLKITLKDRLEEIYVTLFYGVFEKKNVITRAASIENRSGKNVTLKRALSFGLDFMEGDMDLIHFYGKHAGERQFERRNLPHGITEISSSRGTSSHHHNPFVILCDKDTTEDFGNAYGVSFIYSGGFKIQMEKDQVDGIRLVCGLDDEEFLWKLAPGETFVTPEAALSYSEKGLTALSDQFQKAYHANLIRSPWKDKKRPTLVNNWEATYFGFDAEKLLKIAGEAADLGLDMLVLDDGWFGKRNDDNSGLGDWFVNEKKLGCTMKELVDRVNALGLKFGIWLEPEMVSEDSDLYRTHPDWVLQIPGREPNRSRNQLVLDLSRKEVREYMKKFIDDTLSCANISYVKWDMNRSVDNVYSAADPTLSQGAIRHKYVLGLYEVMEDMLTRHPDLLLEGCSGGGGRFDAGMLYYAPQIWCSDNTDAIERLRIHYGTSFGYPMSSVSAHVSVCPNHQNGRVTPFKTRGICAMQGSFGYELDLSKLSEEDKAEARRQITVYNENWELFQSGSYYRLNSPMENHDYTAWSYVSKDQRKASLSVIYTDLHGNPKPVRVKLKGLKKDASYDVDGTVYTGTALMRGGLLIPKPSCNYDSYMVCIHEI
ncbi:alpha-galactosidase [Fusicatenibacter faecihominis]|uniref:Alpha-galactosidase n=1 Tax=Fusicatenibacter faecihominis TaxID=2881276 RepID=A0AAE3DVR8_9FIRM|nr:alpha-galactosidase [Fusicatenibacter faecihominis]MCC2191285.1 alpha-galactosidase [Fusicatenibacter faecihominis]